MKKTASEKTENQIIVNEYRSLIRGISDKVSSTDKKKIRKAFDMAVEAHKNSRRQSGRLYVTHPISVAKIIANDIGLGPISIICSLLHDVVEDTTVSLD